MRARDNIFQNPTISPLIYNDNTKQAVFSSLLFINIIDLSFLPFGDCDAYFRSIGDGWSDVCACM